MDRSECNKNSDDMSMEFNVEDSGNIELIDTAAPSVVDNVGNNVEVEEVRNLAPVEGMCFESVTNAKNYYLKYARSIGFEIAVRDSNYGEDGNLIRVKYACSRGGVVRRKTNKVHNLRPTSKVNCQACMCILRRENGYWVTKVVLEHTHELIPNKGPCYRGNKRMTKASRKRLQLNERAGIRASKNYSSLVAEVGGYEEIRFMEKECMNYLQKERRIKLDGGDWNAVMEYFSDCMREDDNFYYTIFVNDEGRIRSLFWADGRARAAYTYFGDVINFDTTHMRHTYEMPFAMFVGVNHHGKTIILGSALLVDETVSSFVWLFRTWLNCMGSIPPKAMITDQCKAIRKAIEIVFPGIRLNWCQFLITSKISENLRSHQDYKSIKVEFEDAVCNSMSKEEFEDSWGRMISSYHLEENMWLNDLYNDRHLWVPAFIKDCFWAGMSTTPRIEGINCSFGDNLNSSTRMRMFLQQYGITIAKKAEEEAEYDFRCSTSSIECVSDSSFEKQFQVAFTQEKFKEIQEQLLKSIGKYPKVVNDDDQNRLFVVRDKICRNGDTRHVDYVVKFEQETSSVSCKCLLFEFKGILCAHAISVLGYEGIEEVPSRYIMERWRKDVRRMHSYVKFSYKPVSLRASVETYGNFLKIFYELIRDSLDYPD